MSSASDPASIAKRIHVPTYDEILERIGRRRGRARRRPAFEEEIEFLQKVRDVVISKTDFVRNLVRLLDSLHPFYWDLIEVEFDRARLRDSIKCISRSRKMTDKLFERYRILLMASESPREARALGREARGRILSMYKRCSRGLDMIRSLLVFMHKLPAIDVDLPTIIVAGPPSSGKSTFVRSVSRARPKVAPYPFTTKQVHIGHHRIRGTIIQVVDTPGILDRHVDEMSQVERRAAAALRRLEGAVLFLFDPTRDAYLSLGRQARLLEDTVAGIVSGKTVYAVVNKSDIAGKEELESASRVASRSVEKIGGEFLGLMVASDVASTSNIVGVIARREGWASGLLDAGAQ